MIDMFKILKYALLVLLTVTVCSCEKDEIEMTATVDLAGEWMVTFDGVDADGNVYEDPFNAGCVQIITYNTNANRPDEFYINDMENFWEFTVKVPCDNGSKSFGSDSWLDNESYDSRVKVLNGSVVYGGTESPSGMPVDAIQFEIAFDDDVDFDHYIVKGYRRTGLDGGAE